MCLGITLWYLGLLGLSECRTQGLCEFNEYFYYIFPNIILLPFVWLGLYVSKRMGNEYLKITKTIAYIAFIPLITIFLFAFSDWYEFYDQVISFFVSLGTVYFLIMFYKPKQH